MWKCPTCGRRFTRPNQRHACGTGDKKDVLRNRPDALVELYGTIEKFAKSLGRVELVSRERYVLLRSIRIFTDLVIMTDAVRIAIHLRRRVSHPIFFKVAANAHGWTHVAKLKTEADWSEVKDLVKEAYQTSLG